MGSKSQKERNRELNGMEYWNACERKKSQRALLLQGKSDKLNSHHPQMWTSFWYSLFLQSRSTSQQHTVSYPHSHIITIINAKQ